jgi:hypothetical protein
MKTPINELPDKWRKSGIRETAHYCGYTAAHDKCADELESALAEVNQERDQARRYAEAMFPFWPAQKPLPWVETKKTPLDE